MRRVAAVHLVLLAVALAAPVCAEPTAAAPVTAEDPEPVAIEPGLVAVHPNPIADGDAGEFVVTRFPAGTDLSTFAVADGEGRARLPNRTVGGRVVLTAAPDAVPNRTEGTVVAVSGFPRLANGGERVRLVRGNDTVSTLRYADAPEGETRRPGEWIRPGATDLSVVRAGPGTARLFALPDAPALPLAPVENASERVLLAGYTLTSGRVVHALAASSTRSPRRNDAAPRCRSSSRANPSAGSRADRPAGWIRSPAPASRFGS